MHKSLKVNVFETQDKACILHLHLTHSLQSFLSSRSCRSLPNVKPSVGSVDLEQPKVVLAVVLENEVGGRFGPELSTFGEPEQARHLTRL